MTDIKPERKFVKDRLQIIAEVELAKPIKELIVFLDELEVNYKDHQELSIEVEAGYDEEIRFVLYGMRPETDKEQEKRIDKAERARISYERVKAKREAREKATLAELKQKYEAYP